ncbi:MAG: c-type cytochrome [Vampirovibrionales bacterium]
MVHTSSVLRARAVFQPLLMVVAVALLAVGGCSQSTSVRSAHLGQAPVMDAGQSTLDFGYPSRPPSLKHGKEIFTKNCVACHAPSFFQQSGVQKNLLYSTPIDLYILLTTGKAPVLKKETDTHKNLHIATHPAFSSTLSRDDRWAVIFYARYLAGAGDIRHAAVPNHDPDVAAVYGANCAVCHGKKGEANGPLHTGHPSKHELQGGKVHSGLFYPAPARFTQYDRVFNRTDAQWFKYLAEGIYPSGMPAWLGNQDKDKHYVFDETLLWMLVKHLRVLAIANDLPEGELVPSGLMGPAPTVNPLIPPVNKVQTFDYQGAHAHDYFDGQVTHMPWVTGTHQ